MRSISLLVKRLIPVLALVLGSQIQVNAQAWNLPHCSGSGAGRIYYLGATNEIQVLDPATPTFPRGTGIFVPGGARSLAVAPNPNPGPNPTYYTVASVGGTPTLHYYNGSAFVSAGPIMNVDAIAGSCEYIYGLDCAGGFVFRWKTSPAATPDPVTFAASVTPAPSAGGICDLSGDCAGGFWVINPGATTPTVRHYTGGATTTLAETFTMGGTFSAGSEGLAVIGGRVYYDGTDNRLYTGVLNRTAGTVTFAPSTATPFAVIANLDFASCGLEGGCSNRGARDTIYACTSNNDAEVVLSATGAGPYGWTILSGGPATITTSGNSATIRTRNTTTVTYRNADCAGANTIVDTTVILINNAVIDAGADDTVIGCRGQFIDTLRGTIRDTTTGLLWAYDWTPLTGVLQGNNTLDSAIISPQACTKYYLTVLTNTGCSWRDSVNICVADSTPRPNFTWVTNLGCEEDTVRFINTTPVNPYTYYQEWKFGDGNTSLDVSPTHIYADQGIYDVTLIAANQHCTDSIKIAVNILHPLDAQFNVSDTAVCANTLLRFTDASTFTRYPPANLDPIYEYDFGDGTTSNASTTTHTYPTPGTYRVRMRIQDQLGCVDSFVRYIVVDTIPYATFITPDTLICQGQAVNLIADFSDVGNTGFDFDMGDGSQFSSQDSVRYSYQNPGTYNVTFTANYRICPDAVFSRLITVNPFPGINIGEDTVLCPNGAPLALSDRISINNPDARYVWNTGDTTGSITARDIGVYWARVTIGGCSGTDSLTVNKDCYVDIPNVFSPSSTSTNNKYFYPRQFLSRSVASFKMSVFNRWGQTIFETTSLDGRGWDGRFNGKDQPQGVYVYIIDVSFDNGVKEHYTGNVTLLR